ncbi:MAG: vitamin K epoxide reductase family protein [Polyangiaceae bacterium]
MSRKKLLAILTMAASVLGLIFAAYSTFDYGQHLDRQIHAIHCSFIPGASVSTEADNPCKAALFSPYSALFRESYWGGVPISLFALGAFCFFGGFGLYLFMAGEKVPRKAHLFLAAVGPTPLMASAIMFFISLTRLHEFCKICVGIYFSSAVLGLASYFALREWLASADGKKSPDALKTRIPDGNEPENRGKPKRAMDALEEPKGDTSGLQPEGANYLPAAWLVALGACALLPALVYVSSLPDYKPFLTSCGSISVKTEAHNALLKIPTQHPVQAVTLFEDPLCPTCRAFHERLVDEGIFDRLDVTMVMFPLDSDCNWMLDRSLHPGACLVAKSILCGDARARAMLEWSYDNQDDLRDLGKSNPAALRKKISDKWGADILACADDAKTKIRLNQQLHYASDNHIPVSTPQMFLGDKRICDEDTDLGLKYTLAQLAPEVLK